MESIPKSSKLIFKTNLMEFFKESVSIAIEKQKIKTNEIVEFYIVNLLSEFGSIKKVYERDKNEENEPIAILFLKTFHSSLSEQIKGFKKVGDFSLFISGFFSDSLRDKSVDVDYYNSIGKQAYNKLSLILKKISKGETFFNLYQELSIKFQSFTDVLSEVSAMSYITSDKDVLRVYERWLKTKEKRDEGLLQEKGIIPIKSLSTRTNQ
ncbi:MAG: hypothetical protein A2042_08655 [Candidatus Schekmanbacteria bacterium GWA2_38_11]|uniref:Uncharacterized protein n=1 Tax=Candidatus Schekmanbacteria bacterium GWA2_38_11 TaxID=1817876 RepID=A0A1F7R9U4_9BACT|nr:MAG: hypothetical protein A2042_08655 [Candidatus Schekmanbacteria bacterium GWA2_38_11]